MSVGIDRCCTIQFDMRYESFFELCLAILSHDHRCESGVQAPPPQFWRIQAIYEEIRADQGGMNEESREKLTAIRRASDNPANILHSPQF